MCGKIHFMKNAPYNIRNKRRAGALFFALFALVVPSVGVAQTNNSLEISGWVPYWRSEKGVASILPELGAFTEVNPFVYTVKTDGSLYQASSVTGAEWVQLKAKAKELNVRFVPTVTWANPNAMDDIFRDPAKRQKHIQAITREVFQYGFDGIDIDYEGKYARTRPYFSLFLKELNGAIGYNKWVMCTIEARTPLDARYSSPEAIPKDIDYSNDFKEINKYCDRVRIMAYDQGRIDLKLNEAKGHPYVPVADTEWVEKVVRLASEEIDKDKIMIAVPTYGYEYDMFTLADGSGKPQYAQLWSFNPGYAADVASKLGIQPVRSSAGELTLTFPASQSPEPEVPLPQATRVLSWSDAESIRQKAALAVKLGVRGVSVFKIDGGQDASLWNVISQYKDANVVRTASKPLDVALAQDAGTSVLAKSSPTAVASVPKKNLELGAVSEEVRALQKFLNANGFLVATTGAGSPGKETIRFGAATQQALIRFQKQNKIAPAKGYLGPLTRAKMRSL